MGRGKLVYVNNANNKYDDLCVCVWQTLGCNPIASLDHFQAEMLGTAELVEEVQTGDSKVVKVTDAVFLSLVLSGL